MFSRKRNLSFSKTSTVRIVSQIRKRLFGKQMAKLAHFDLFSVTSPTTSTHLFIHTNPVHATVYVMDNNKWTDKILTRSFFCLSDGGLLVPEPQWIYYQSIFSEHRSRSHTLCGSARSLSLRRTRGYGRTGRGFKFNAWEEEWVVKYKRDAMKEDKEIRKGECYLYLPDQFYLSETGMWKMGNSLCWSGMNSDVVAKCKEKRHEKCFKNMCTCIFTYCKCGSRWLKPSAHILIIELNWILPPPSNPRQES